MRRIRGIRDLVHDAVDLTVDLVEEGHESSARNVKRALSWIEPLAGSVELVDDIRRLSTAGVLGSIRAVNRLTRFLLDAGFEISAVRAILVSLEERGAAPVPMRSDAFGTALWWGDAATAALNGVIGDNMHRRSNGLDIGTRLRHDDVYLEPGAYELRSRIAEPSGKVAVFVHGLAASEWSWCWNAEAYHGDPSANFGSLLRKDLGYEPFFARYNTGRHVSENGRLLAERLEELTALYPAPVEEIALVGHSMGGLVLRSACHQAKASGHAWVSRVRRVFCLGTPHRGAPLEKFGNLATAVLGGIDHPATLIPGALLRRRSAGIKDLRHGSLVDEDWLGRDPDALAGSVGSQVPLLDDVAYHFVSAAVTRDTEHPLGQIVGDVLVRVPSASGPLLKERTFTIETRCYGGVLHHELQNHPDVYALVRAACAGTEKKIEVDVENGGAAPTPQ